MSKITIDDLEYDTDAFSDHASANLQSLQFVDAELARTQAQIAVMQTARIAYIKALKEAISGVPSNDTKTLN